MKTFQFVLVVGEVETPLPLEDVEEASCKAEAGGVVVERRRDGQKTTLEAEGVMAVIGHLSDMPKYRGQRIDAVEVGIPPS